ncbi:phospholipase D-like protein [Jatrophihabitans sp. GAS493]|uniref:PLD nuclease N-terminal domain-containing protein n=1 Tax=Jatrophihabitans sp. GAS493 TaxID=1907575 RepID=UPI000BB68745|nr:PLD nuclease N-terminal domain-containing protein [Jatrophihabitans sp. GAS493]SOD70615.1 phospholipase D-like protein [Jatrophihabitans sp. GAS493]
MLVRLGGIFSLIGLLIWIYAVIDSITAPAERIRLLPKAVWVLIVLLFSVVGSVLWFVFGRPYSVAGVGGATRGRGGAATAAGPSPASFVPPTLRKRSSPMDSPRGIAPDDDVDFLRKIDEDLRRGDGNPGSAGGSASSE